jgi:hypothetical protein
MRRIAALLAVFLILAPPAVSHAQRVATATDNHFGWIPLAMRNTSAASVARNANWAAGQGGIGVSSTVVGFADSTVLRRAVTTLTVYDTSQAVAVNWLPFAPQLLYKGGSTALADTAQVLPWIGIRVAQDTLSYGYTSNSALDSISVGTQWSLDGINWNAVAGTPTIQPAAAYFTSGEDGVAPLGMKAGELTSPASDVCQLYIVCNMNEVTQQVTASATLPIMNKTLCEVPGYIRFIIGMDGTGQFAVSIGRWTND